MAAREHHPELVVPERGRQKELLYNWPQGPFALDPTSELRRKPPSRAFAAQQVDRAVLGGRHQERRVVLRDSVDRPRFDGLRERVLHHVFRERQVPDAKDARERGQETRPLMPKKVLAWLLHRYGFSTGRTSTTPPSSKPGQVPVSSTACAKSFASTSVNPITMSFVSAYGPSETLPLPRTTPPPVCANGWPMFLMCPLFSRSVNQALHRCRRSCI